MNSTILVGIIAAIAIVLAAAIGVPRVVRDPLGQIQKQVEIFQGLPEKSPARAVLLARIEEQVARLDTESTARRYPLGIALGILFLVLAGATTWLVYVGGGWWWLTAPVLLVFWLIGIVGLVTALEKVPRTADGTKIEHPQVDEAS